jgi:hypothetical protein
MLAATTLGSVHRPRREPGRLGRPIMGSHWTAACKQAVYDLNDVLKGIWS